MDTSKTISQNGNTYVFNYDQRNNAFSCVITECDYDVLTLLIDHIMDVINFPVFNFILCNSTEKNIYIDITEIDRNRFTNGVINLTLRNVYPVNKSLTSVDIDHLILNHNRIHTVDTVLSCISGKKIFVSSNQVWSAKSIESICSEFREVDLSKLKGIDRVPIIGLETLSIHFPNSSIGKTVTSADGWKTHVIHKEYNIIEIDALPLSEIIKFEGSIIN